MKRGLRPAHEIKIVPRWRIYLGKEIALGPGKAELLARIKDTGSLVDAAQAMEMSYMRAWLLVKSMNGSFGEPVVELRRGGKAGGGAALTQTGCKVLELYEKLAEDSLLATKSIQAELVALAKK